MSTTMWVDDKMYVVDEPVREHVDQLQAELDTAQARNKRLRKELEEIALMGNTLSCKKAEQFLKENKP